MTPLTWSHLHRLASGLRRPTRRINICSLMAAIVALRFGLSVGLGHLAAATATIAANYMRDVDATTTTMMMMMMMHNYSIQLSTLRARAGAPARAPAPANAGFTTTALASCNALRVHCGLVGLDAFLLPAFYSHSNRAASGGRRVARNMDDGVTTTRRQPPPKASASPSSSL